jgi:hypothetical protein
MRAFVFASAVVVVALAVFAATDQAVVTSRFRRLLFSGVNPGPLSSAHRSLDESCAACHTPVVGPDRDKCVGCHAANLELFARQPTAFHQVVESCRGCHAEHLGRDRRPTAMDHSVLEHVARASDEKRPGTALDCVSCHAMQDRHGGFFGSDCAECHSDETWSVAGYTHPSPASTECAQCHLAPPSHFMGHFHMVSAQVAGMHQAVVFQCYACHQTTAWNDIRGVGWYKHH